ncbi:murein hydrolase activator EnvC [Erythrobacter sp. YT30]|uniref:murein hydrolase activator EnvC family protein n=1 Tax=Erythrobacter sp. YT30 TaxID=1735012 RepID=UPI00076CB56D|nr:peptidoglycan DD-metalloendopeptidase family protein [Erythrobacter sp. YT30]KWV91376.1 metalloendopeptidase [Erythrobacter sp. YT30]
MQRFIVPALLAGIAGLMLAIPSAYSQRSAITLTDPETAASELERATKESARAEERAARLQAEADEAIEAADKAAREAAALAARVQQSEADITAAQARYSLAQARRQAISARLAERREPLVRLTSALQTTSRRPVTLSALQPGSLKDLVYVRAVLATAVPEIRSRTSDLRSELERGKVAEQDAADALGSVRQAEVELQQRRVELAAIEEQQRLASQNARSNAVRENERALALAEEARDLDGLIDRLDNNAKLRRELAALPGPKIRPANLSAAPSDTAIEDPAPDPTQAPQNGAAPSPFQLPVQGRTLAGFGERGTSGLPSNGIALVPSPGAQVVAPASGRIVFAGPYRGYDRIVIIEHENGWTSLVTGMGRIDVGVGASVIAGSPLGIAARSDPIVSVEVRQDGDTVNPLELMR